ncbi:hypothetical protein ACFQZT_07655 [Paenibacillus sp. GCM10027628]|uniref:hypothetical protein n=1 Tax=Paenibacillus sp. GCM10027628 TaxID=3273413 RepID=UPI00364003CC
MVLENDEFIKGLPKVINKLKESLHTVKKRVRRLSAEVSDLRQQVNRIDSEGVILRSRVIQNEQVFGTELAAVRSQVNGILAGGGQAEAARQFLGNRTGSPAIIDTNAGAVSGTVLAVGSDHVEMLEPNGTIALIPLMKVGSVS